MSEDSIRSALIAADDEWQRMRNRIAALEACLSWAMGEADLGLVADEDVSGRQHWTCRACDGHVWTRNCYAPPDDFPHKPNCLYQMSVMALRKS